MRHSPAPGNPKALFRATHKIEKGFRTREGLLCKRIRCVLLSGSLVTGRTFLFSLLPVDVCARVYGSGMGEYLLLTEVGYGMATQNNVGGNQETGCPPSSLLKVIDASLNKVGTLNSSVLSVWRVPFPGLAGMDSMFSFVFVWCEPVGEERRSPAPSGTSCQSLHLRVHDG